MEHFFDPASYHFSWFTVPLVTVGLLNWALGAATLWRERGSPPSRSLLAMTFVIGVWLLALGGATATDNATAGLIWVKLSMLGTVFVPVAAFVHAAMGSSKERLSRTSAILGVTISSVLAVLVLTTHLVLEGAHRYFWGYYPIYGALGPVLIAYYGIFLSAGGALYRMGHATTKSDTHRKRMRLRFAALMIVIPATIDFLPTMGIGIYPIGYIFILGYISISTFSIWRYRLIDITPALAAKQVLAAMGEGLLVVDRDGVIRVANDAAEDVCNRGRPLVSVPLHDVDRRWGNGALAQLMDPEVNDECEVEYEDADGDRSAALVATSKLLDHLGAWVGTVFIIHDMTERARAERALRESEERFRSLVQNASDLITVIEPDTTIVYQSPTIRRVLGYDATAAIGRKLIDFIHPDDQPRVLGTLAQLMSGSESVAGEGRVRDSKGGWRDLEFTGTDQRHHPSIRGVVLNVRDISERRQLEEQIRYQALHDPLTGLANRTRFLDRLDHAIERGAESGSPLAVMFLDLDDFKGINDTLGHSAGDSLLIEMSQRLQASLRPADTIARLGGDEFAMIVEDIDGHDETTAIVERVFLSLQEPFNISGKDVTVRVSIGIATNHGHPDYTAEQLIRDADVAMYSAKAQGKGCYRVFESSMEVSMLERLEMLTDLPRALMRSEFILHYQPIVVLSNGDLFGLEALVRWQHPKRGLLAPTQFIPLAEECGAIVEIGSWVLHEACRQAAEWQARYGSAVWTLSVNVSVKQLQQAGFVDEVRRVLEETGLAPSRLILEITESVVMHDVPMMLKRLNELKALGIGLALDDFGTGYSSLGYLREFPFDLLKIDRSFVHDVAGDTGAKDLTKGIIELGRTLDLELVAEGIERQQQLNRLRVLECDLGQGFYFSHPLEAHAAEAALATLAAAGEHAA